MFCLLPRMAHTFELQLASRPAGLNIYDVVHHTHIARHPDLKDLRFIF